MAKPSGQRSPSIEALKQRMARDPLSRAFLQLAEEYRKSGQFEDAVHVCLEGLERHPGYHTARISLGRTYLESGDLENARTSLAEVLELAPENHLAGKLLAEVQRRLGDQSGAVETYRAILRHYPGDREVETLLNDLQQGGTPPTAATPTAPPAQSMSPAPPAPPDPPDHFEPVHPAPADDQPFVGVSVPQPPERLGPTLPPVPPERPLPGPFTFESIGPPPSPLPLASGVIPRSPQAGGDDAGDEEQPDALQTNTLAELYLRQGLVDRAVEVYRSMLCVDPGNVRARRRLGELTAGDGEEKQRTSGQEDEPIAAPDPPGQSDTAVPPALRIAPQPERLETGAGPRPRRQTIARLEKWLGTIRHQKPDPPGGAIQ